MGGKTKPPYPEAFRQQLVELVASGRSVGELAREFNVDAQSIHNWVKKSGRVIDLPRGAEVLQAARASQVAAQRMALSGEEREELLRLRKQVRQLQLERDILSKATAWFAHKSEKTSLGATN